jgi:DNA polymerase III alpha subunit
MKEQLSETYGVMVYQEDVIKVRIHFAGMDGTDADILRRGMSGKYRSKKEFEWLVQRFFEEAKKLGRPDEVVAEVRRQVSSLPVTAFPRPIPPASPWTVTGVCSSKPITRASSWWPS